jgi:membrane protease YdiL (CAAX protease family)
MSASVVSASKPSASVETQVSVFLGLTILFSLPFWLLLARYKMDGHWPLHLGIMCAPGVAGLVSALVCRVPLGRFGWRWPQWKWIAAGYFIPIGYSAIAYSFLWTTGLGHLQQNPYRLFVGSAQMHGMPVWAYLLAFIPLGAIMVVLGLLGGGTLGALGEEIGWRGFLVPALATRLSFTQTSLATGIVWALWHVPLLLFAGYKGHTPRWYSLLCFSAMVIPMGFLYVWVRVRSGSLWPCVLLHQVHNLWIQNILTPSTGDTGPTRWWVNEFGAALAIVSILMGLYIWLKQRNSMNVRT